MHPSDEWKYPSDLIRHPWDICKHPLNALIHASDGSTYPTDTCAHPLDGRPHPRDGWSHPSQTWKTVPKSGDFHPRAPAARRNFPHPAAASRQSAAFCLDEVWGSSLFSVERILAMRCPEGQTHLYFAQAEIALLRVVLTGVGTARPHCFRELGTSRPRPCRKAQSMAALSIGRGRVVALRRPAPRATAQRLLVWHVGIKGEFRPCTGRWSSQRNDPT